MTLSEPHNPKPAEMSSWAAVSLLLLLAPIALLLGLAFSVYLAGAWLFMWWNERGQP